MGSPLDFLNNLIPGAGQQAGLNQAAAGTQAAADQSRAFSQLQWDRQMQGLAQAQGATNPYRSLYDRIYGTSTAKQQPNTLNFQHTNPLQALPPMAPIPPPANTANPISGITSAAGNALSGWASLLGLGGGGSGDPHPNPNSPGWNAYLAAHNKQGSP